MALVAQEEVRRLAAGCCCCEASSDFWLAYSSLVGLVWRPKEQTVRDDLLVSVALTLTRRPCTILHFVSLLAACPAIRQAGSMS